MKKSDDHHQTNTKISSQSNAYVERAQIVEAMVRTMKEVIEDKAQTGLSATDSITTLMIRHAASWQTRFSVGRDGKSPFKRRHHKDYTSQLLPFGSAVDAKVRDEDTESSKFDSRFVPGIWRNLRCHCFCRKLKCVSIGFSWQFTIATVFLQLWSWFRRW